MSELERLKSVNELLKRIDDRHTTWKLYKESKQNNVSLGWIPEYYIGFLSDHKIETEIEECKKQKVNLLEEKDYLEFSIERKVRLK